MTNLELFKGALQRCEEYANIHPQEYPLWTILADQLAYLVELEAGRRDDRERLATLCVGVMAAKNVEDRDMQLADMLYKVQREVRIMLSNP
jgi:hypothetical protein